MKKFLLTMVAAALCLSANATVLAYKLKYSLSRTGSNNATRTSVSGYLVIDTETPEVALVKLDSKARQFNVEYPAAELSDINGAKFKTFSVVQIADDEISGKMTFKGTDSPKNIAGAPSRLAISGADTWSNDGGVTAFLDEYKGSGSLDKNIVGSRTLDELVDAITAQYEASGMTESETF